MAVVTVHGLERVANPRKFADAVAAFESMLVAKGLMVFAKIDFSGDAARTGLKMPQTQMVIFGNPKAGTPVMVATPSVAIDLPLKVVFSEEADGKVWMSYNSPEYLAERHGIPADLQRNLAGVRDLVAAAAR